jgi:hypothetical protein
MYKYLTLLICFAFYAFTSFSQAPCDIKSCKIEYEFFDGVQKGTKRLIFDDSGWTEKQIVFSILDSTKLPPFPSGSPEIKTVSNILTLKTLKWVYNIDLDLKIGQRSPRTLFSMKSMTDNLMKRIGVGVFLNRTCVIYDFNGYKIWIWKGVTLKKELAFPDGSKVYEIAISIDENYIIDKSEFKVPSGVKIED